MISDPGFVAPVQPRNEKAPRRGRITVTLYLTTKHNSLCQRFVRKHMGVEESVSVTHLDRALPRAP
jgi:hypothetical protein